MSEQAVEPRRRPLVTTIIHDNGRSYRVAGEYPKPKSEKIRSTPEMRAELRVRREEEQRIAAELEIVMQEERRELRIRNKGAEYERIEHTRTVKINGFKARTDQIVLDTDNHRREVRKVATILSKLEKGNRLERDLALVINQFARRVADGHGAATLEGDDSTNRLTSAYEPIGIKAGFGSKTPSDPQIDGMRCHQQMKEQIPPRLMKIFTQLVNEETAGWHDRAQTLTQMGEAIGYEKSQASAAGGGLVYAVCAIVEHFMRKNGYLTFGRARESLEK